MSTPRTGPLGGYGDQILGGDVEPGDLSQALPGIIRHYRMNDGSPSGTLSDQCGHAPLVVHTLDGTNTLTIQSGGPEGPSAHIPNGSVVYGTGSSSYAIDSTTDLSGAFPSGGTLAFWFKPDLPDFTVADSHPSEMEVFQIVKFISASGLFGIYQQGLGLNIVSKGATGSAGGNLTDLTMADGQWYKVRITWSPSPASTKVWVDDVLRFEQGFCPNTFNESSVHFGIGECGGDGTWANISGYSTHYLTFTGNIDDIAIYNDIHAGSGYDPTKIKYASATTSVLLSPSSITLHPVRVTAMYGEGLVADSSNARLTSETVEVMRTGSYSGRTTGFYAEVLRSLPVETFNVSATTSFSLAASSTGSASRIYNVSATTSFGVSSIDTSRLGVQRPVSASTAVNFVATARGYVPAIYSLAARSDMNVVGSGTAVVHNPQPYFVSASTNLNLSPSARIGLARVLQLAASTGLTLSGAAYAPSTFRVAATSGLFVSGHGNGRTASVFVSASTGITLSSKASKPFVFGPRFVSASTSFNLTTPASTKASLLLNVSALTSMQLADLASELKCGPVLVFAASNFRLTQKLTYTNPGPRYATATTNLSLATAASYTRLAILTVSATTGIALSSAGSEVALFNIGASSGFVLTGAGRQNRDIMAAAATSLGLSNLPKTSNLKALDASATMTFTVSAFSLIAGTEAGSGLVLTDLAQAVVWIPWRRTTLTLLAGGNLPHS